MMLHELVKKSRSCRRYQADRSVNQETLLHLVDTARFIPSAWNRQPLKYIISSSVKQNHQIIPYLTWPQFGSWDHPNPEEEPSAFIIILGDLKIASHFGVEAGIAAQTILLGATEFGLAGCIFGRFDEQELHQKLHIPKDLKALLILALGYPSEQIILEENNLTNPTGFWRDDQGIQRVNKRPLSEVLVNWNGD